MDAIDLLTQDHRAVEVLFDSYDSADSPPAKREIAEKFTRELSIHAAIEEQLIYPLMRYKLDDGAKKADHAVEEHAEVKKLLAQIEKTDTTDESFFSACQAVMSAVKHHVKEEESELFLELRQKVGRDQLEKVGALMEQAKKLAPTHPHPLVPGTATAQLLAGPWASIADHIRDFVDDVKKKAS